MQYHPETNGQCERFNQTLISIFGTFEGKDKHHWKECLPTLLHAYNCTKNNATGFSPYSLMYGQKPRLPIDIKLGLVSPQAEGHSHNKFLAKLNTWLRWCYQLADLHQCHKQWYDWKMRASRQAWTLIPLSGEDRKYLGANIRSGIIGKILNMWLLSDNWISQYTLLNPGKERGKLW